MPRERSPSCYNENIEDKCLKEFSDAYKHYPMGNIYARSSAKRVVQDPSQFDDDTLDGTPTHARSTRSRRALQENVKYEDYDISDYTKLLRGRQPRATAPIVRKPDIVEDDQMPCSSKTLIEPVTQTVVKKKKPKITNSALPEMFIVPNPTFDFERPSSDVDLKSDEDDEDNLIQAAMAMARQTPNEEKKFARGRRTREHTPEDSCVKKKFKKAGNISPGCRELYDFAPIRALRVNRQKPTRKQPYLLECTTKWVARWNEAIQIMNKSDKEVQRSQYTSEFPTAFSEFSVKRKFKLPEKLVTSRKSTAEHPVHGDKYELIEREPMRSYLLDATDWFWLEKENLRRLVNGLPKIDAQTFLRIMDTFETDCYTGITRTLLEQITNSRRFFDDPEDVACDICYVGDSEEDDKIVFCDGCETVVHQSCYGLNSVPEGSWLCDVCLLVGAPRSCLICPLPHGAMKRTDCKSGFVHISCSLWMPEVIFGDVQRRDRIKFNMKFDRRKTRAVCQVCNCVYGACLFCCAEGCQTAFHVTCAQRAGFTLKVVQEVPVKFLSFCREHTLAELPPGTKVTNSYIRAQPLTTREDLERHFILFTNIKNEALQDLHYSIVFEVFEYWKLKRAHAGKALIHPSRIKESFMPVYKEVPVKKNEISRRSEPGSLRLAADKMRTLWWMTQEREQRKTDALRAVGEFLFNTLNTMAEKNQHFESEEQIDEIDKLLRGMVGNPTIMTPERDVPIKWVPDDTKLEDYPSPSTEFLSLSPTLRPKMERAEKEEIVGFDFDDSERNSAKPTVKRNRMSYAQCLKVFGSDGKFILSQKTDRGDKLNSWKGSKGTNDGNKQPPSDDVYSVEHVVVAL